MQHTSKDESDSNYVASNRTMNIVVALLLMAAAVVVMISSYELGSGWAPGLGPDSGYFPFYIGLFLFAAGGYTLVEYLRLGSPGGGFIYRGQLNTVLQVLIPATIFVVLSIYIGIYISMVLFIGFFMFWHGKYSPLKILPVVIVVPVVLFVIFEVWFLVPLPKGPVEAWLGY